MSEEPENPRESPEAPRHLVGQEPPEAGTRYSAKEIHDTVVASANDELQRPIGALWWSALAAGFLISFSFIVAGFLSTLSADPAMKRLLAALGYPLGFVFVVLGSAQLFTENTLDPVLPLLERPTLPMLGRVARLWAIVLLGNLVGAFCIGWVLARTAVVPVWLGPELDTLARSAVEGGFSRVLFLAVFAGWLIALMAWLVNTTVSTGAQITLIFLTTAPISALGFRHAIAGGVEAFYFAARGLEAFPVVVLEFLLPTVIGNMVGGVLMVALMFHGQVRSDRIAEVEAQNGARERERSR
jgi:formate/nitrite transporter FocA (FNT family)